MTHEEMQEAWAKAGDCVVPGQYIEFGTLKRAAWYWFEEMEDRYGE